jgi:hypothetical protein
VAVGFPARVTAPRLLFPCGDETTEHTNGTPGPGGVAQDNAEDMMGAAVIVCFDASALDGLFTQCSRATSPTPAQTLACRW